MDLLRKLDSRLRGNDKHKQDMFLFLGLPKDVSTYGGQIDSLYYLILYITGAIFFLVEGALIYFIIRYRGRPGRKAIYSHGNNTVELIWTLIPGCILLFLAFYQQHTWVQVKEDLPPANHSLLIELKAQQFAWNFRYAGDDGKFGTPDDRLTLDKILVPLHTPVIIQMQSFDVIHSFAVPAMRIKQDVVPGLTTHVWFEATQPGTFEVVCDQLCGMGHTKMRGEVVVVSEKEFQKWLHHLPTEAEEKNSSDRQSRKQMAWGWPWGKK